MCRKWVTKGSEVGYKCSMIDCNNNAIVSLYVTKEGRQRVLFFCSEHAKQNGYNPSDQDFQDSIIVTKSSVSQDRKPIFTDNCFPLADFDYSSDVDGWLSRVKEMINKAEPGAKFEIVIRKC